MSAENDQVVDPHGRGGQRRRLARSPRRRSEARGVVGKRLDFGEGTSRGPAAGGGDIHGIEDEVERSRREADGRRVLRAGNLNEYLAKKKIAAVSAVLLFAALNFITRGALRGAGNMDQNTVDARHRELVDRNEVGAGIVPSGGIMENNVRRNRSNNNNKGESDWDKIPPHLRGHYAKMHGAGTQFKGVAQSAEEQIHELQRKFDKQNEAEKAQKQQQAAAAKEVRRQKQAQEGAQKQQKQTAVEEAQRRHQQATVEAAANQQRAAPPAMEAPNQGEAEAARQRAAAEANRINAAKEERRKAVEDQNMRKAAVLNLQRITYQDTPTAIIEQIALKEAVYPIHSLEDMKTRLGPGRRCFAFFRPSLPHKPLVFVHVALLRDIPKSMNDLQYATESDAATCATFYSIAFTETVLAGMDLGNHLIKSVIQVLRDEFPKLSLFCTLSPVPKFKEWLEGKLVRYNEDMPRKQDGGDGSGSSHRFMDDRLLGAKELNSLGDIFPSETPLLNLLETLKSPSWHVTASTGGDEVSVSPLANRLEPVLMKLAAYYLTIEKYSGRPLCPMAKFHIHNGAEMYRLNYMADTSASGIRNGCGMMVNYRYSLDEMEENRARYEINGDVVARDGVTRWLNLI